MKKLASCILLALLFVSMLTLALNVQSVELKDTNTMTTLSVGWLEGWKYRRSHFVNGALVDLENYQIEMVVNYAEGWSSGKNVSCNNHCRIDFGDVRLTQDDGVTLLDYWIQKKTEGDFAIFWVEVNHIPIYPDAAKIYIYYGNPDATTTSNGASTFICYENWENFGGDMQNPDWPNWVEYMYGDVQASNATSVDGIYSGWKSGLAYVNVYDLGFLQNVVGEVEVRIEDYEESRSYSAMVMTLGSEGGLGIVGYQAITSTTKYIYRIGGPGTEVASSIALKPMEEWHTYRIGSTSTGTKMWVDDDLVCSIGNVVLANAAGIGAFWSEGGCKAFWDAWRVRKYVDPTPVSSYWSSEFEQGVVRVPENYPTIQEAINAASDGDTIFVRNGTYYEHVVVNKTIDLIGEDRGSTIVDGDNTGNVVTLVSNNANVSGFTFQHSAGALYSCIRLDQVSGCSIFSNIANNSNSSPSGDGIFLQSSKRNNISGNLVINTWDGITFRGSCNNTISGNTVVNLFDVGGTSIQFVYGSAFNQAIGNAFLGIAQIGIRCYQGDSGSNVLIGNRVENHWFGIYADGSSNNIFYHNSIVNNTINQTYVPSSVNVWDNGYPNGGNYWSDYTGIDANSDGIGDSPYVIDANNQDNYPLMKPYAGPHDIGIVSLSVSKTVIAQGVSALIRFEVINYGIDAETFNVAVYANESNIFGLSIYPVPGRHSVVFVFSWITTPFAVGSYTISAYASPVYGETDLSDNTLTHSPIIVTIPGDVNGDFFVNIADVGQITANWLESVPPAPANADINGDFVINIADVGPIATNWLKHA